MNKQLTLNGAGRLLMQAIAAVLSFWILPVVADRMVDAGRPSFWFGLAAAAVAVVGVAPFLLLLAVVVFRHTDEWNRHVALVGYVAALTGAALWFTGVEYLRAAEVVGPWAFTPASRWLLVWLLAGLGGSWLWHRARG